MKIRISVLAAALAMFGVVQAQANDHNRGRGNDHGRWQSRSQAAHHPGHYRPVIVHRPRVIVVPAPRYGRHDSYRSYPRYGYGSYVNDRYYGAPGYGWPGYVTSYPSGGISLTLSLPLR